MTPIGLGVLFSVASPAECSAVISTPVAMPTDSAGLATLTHTPSPMGFLNEILGRPADAERPFLLLVVGHPAADARVPAIERKAPAAIVTWVEGG